MATFTWGGGDGAWKDLNWVVGGVPSAAFPGTSDAVIVNAAGRLKFGFLATDSNPSGFPLFARSILVDNAAATLDIAASVIINHEITIDAGVVHPIANNSIAGFPWVNNGGTFLIDQPRLFFSLANGLSNNAQVIISGGVLLTAEMVNNAAGTILVENGGTIIETNIANAGLLELSGGSLIHSLSGRIGAVHFRDGDNNTLIVPGTGAIDAVVSGFRAGDTITLFGVTFDASYQANLAADLLTISSAGGVVQSLRLSGLQDGAHVTIANDGTGRPALTTDSVPCFRTGTQLQTAAGPVAVERLRIGDTLALAAGGFAPITWVGRRRLDCRRHPAPHDVLPIRIRAGAFARHIPCRDLWLSPDHAVAVDGVLIPVRYLVNGASIAQVAARTVTYWHVELARHDILIAEALPVESYLDTGNRASFQAGREADRGRAELARQIWQARAVAPLLLGGPRVKAVRSRLFARCGALGLRHTGEPALSLLADARPLAFEWTGTSVMARLPAGTREVRIVTRTHVPAHMCPDSSDFRELGVAAAGFMLDAVPLALDDRRIATGWHQPEAHWRWTAGNAAVAVNGARLFHFDIAIAGRYWIDGSHRSDGRRPVLIAAPQRTVVGPCSTSLPATVP